MLFGICTVHLKEVPDCFSQREGGFPSAAANLGLEGRIDHDERYDRAEEFMEVCYALWVQSWEDDAVERDADAGQLVCWPWNDIAG
ncbi:hypothetical protein ACFQJ7_01515 [Halovenus rubra]|uniref:Luciferase-like monooxygenase n=2 Tax=Halovenus rubra TaxID=869890 RepID=A0ABD5X0M4_9EURY|nr:hypothetical protein [Halovenus rubra]